MSLAYKMLPENYFVKAGNTTITNGGVNHNSKAAEHKTKIMSSKGLQCYTDIILGKIPRM